MDGIRKISNTFPLKRGYVCFQKSMLKKNPKSCLLQPKIEPQHKEKKFA